MKRFGSYIALLLISMVALAHMLPAMFPFPSRPDEKDSIKAQPILVTEDETIPDSLLHPRWKIKKTSPILVSDLDTSAVDLRMPDNIKQQAEYDDSTGVYLIGSKIGSTYLNAPILMMPEEYQ